MPTPSRERQPQDEVTGHPAPAPSAGTDGVAARILALQRTAGNAAVAGLLQRKFYEKTDKGEYVWHAEDPTGDWEDTEETTWWLLPIWRYPVYQRAQPAVTTPDATSATKKKRRPRAKQKKAESVTADAPTSEPKSAPEPPAVTAPPVTAAAEPDDDEGEFTTPKSKREKQAEAASRADVPGLRRTIDRHTGEPDEILTSFNRLFNGMSAQGMLALGNLQSAYRAGSDGATGFSVEVTIPGLANWVIHMHCDADGDMATGPNPTHYKRVTERGALGVSIALTPRQIAGLIPDAAARRQKAVDRRLVPAR